MRPSRNLPLPAKSVVAVMLVVVCIMFFMAWAELTFRGPGYQSDFVFYVSRIAGLPAMLFLVWLIVRQHREFLARMFSISRSTLRLVATGILVGLLARLFSWSLITGRAAFGILPSSEATPSLPFQWAYGCPEIETLITSVVVWLVLVPVTEEFVHRGVILSALAHRGPLIAIGLSAIFFALMHPPGSYLFVFLFGIVFGILYWNARSLWPPIATHATYDGLKIFDSMCLQVTWNPSHDDLPLLGLGVICAIIVASCAAAIGFLISKRWIGPLDETQSVA